METVIMPKNMPKKPISKKVESSSTVMMNSINRELGEIKVTQLSFSEIFTNHLKIDEKIRDDLDQINSTLIRNTVSLEEHMKRSDNIEKITEQLDKRLEYIEIDRESNNKTVKMILKIIAGLMALASGITGIVASL